MASVVHRLVSREAGLDRRATLIGSSITDVGNHIWWNKVPVVVL